MRKVGQRLNKRLGENGPERLATLVALLLVAFGTALRLRGMFGSPIPLWLDETTWAMFLVDEPLTKHMIRPIGFMALSRAIVSVFSLSETPLRAIPLLGGIGATLMAPFIAKRLFDTWKARLLFVAIVALHPAAIDLSKEFKPYSSGFALHLAMMLLALRYLGTGKTSHLLQTLLVCAVAVLFTQDAVFAYPGVFLTLGIGALKLGNRRQLLYAALGALVTIGVVLGLYLLMWRGVKEAEPSSYWGNKYDVFYVADSKQPDSSQLAWTLRKWGEVTGLPALRNTKWTPQHVSRETLELLKSFESALWLALHLLGLLAMAFRRRFYEPLLLLLPLLVAVGFNALGLFPFGVFRTDLFLLAYIAAIAPLGLDGPALPRARWTSAAPALLLVLVPALAFEPQWHTEKRYFASHGSMPDTVEQLGALRRQGQLTATPRIVADPQLCDPWRYYSEYHPYYSTLLSGLKVQLKCETGGPAKLRAARQWLEAGEREVWLLVIRPRTVEAQRHAFGSSLVLRRMGHSKYVTLYRVRAKRG